MFGKNFSDKSSRGPGKPAGLAPVLLCKLYKKIGVMTPMLDNLLFSLNISLPLFVMMGLGCLLAHKGLFTEDYIARTTDLVYYVLLPGKLFLDIATMDLSTAFDVRYMAVTLTGAMLQFGLAWVCGNLLCRDRRKQSAFAHACFRGNFVYLGVALLQNIYNTNSVASAALILLVVMPLYNIQGVILMSVKEGKGELRLGSLLLAVLKNPAVLAILAGLPFAWFQIPLPYVASKSLEYFRSALSTVALLLVGSTIRLDVIRSNLRLLLKISGVKLVLIPALWAAFSAWAGLTAEQIATLTIVGAMPAAVNVYVVTGKMGGDGEVASGAVVLTHLLSLFTMTGVVFLLKSLGMV